MITHQLERISRSKYIDNIIVAISDNPKDDILKERLQGDYNIFRGDENDVLRRFYGVIEAYGIPDEAMIIRLTADCPLIDWRLIDELIEHFCRIEVDYLSNAFPRLYPDGMDAEIFRAKALKIAHQNATTAYEREHTTPYIRHSERFKKGLYPNPHYIRNGDSLWTPHKMSNAYEPSLSILATTTFHCRILSLILKLNPSP